MNHWTQPSRLDRLEEFRSAEKLAELWPGARVLQVDVEGRFAAAQGRPVPLADAGNIRPDDVLLGRHRGQVWFGRLGEVTAGEPTSWRASHPDDWDLTASAVALLRWHATNPVCEACHSRTIHEPGGNRRICQACGTLAFARQDPAVIVAITDPADRLLLGRQASWPEGRFSVVAGFVEAGESLEQAVWREIEEEVGVKLSGVTYVSSQPWPMPKSLMLGFAASAPDSHVEPDGVEIVEARYWSRDELRTALASGELTLPGGISIARQLIDAWQEGTLPSASPIPGA